MGHWVKSPPETIAGFFERDHRALERAFMAVPFAAAASAAARFAEFDRRLERHFRWEEGLLFPAAARLSEELEVGPLLVLQREHQEIRREKAAARRALAAGDAGRAIAHAGAMALLLDAHNAEEEEAIYPACDGLFPPEVSERILAELRRQSMLCPSEPHIWAPL